ncbi:hypothetical protein [Bifidobacterium castoris]|uniref:hypothetical protein n=1 Tax=Bifidobacterium castoris TaxID=2306972 RepID=UPI000F7EF144|nr:hypothetical protein [Bifidobacterium castoris]
MPPPDGAVSAQHHHPGRVPAVVGRRRTGRAIPAASAIRRRRNGPLTAVFVRHVVGQRADGAARVGGHTHQVLLVVACAVETEKVRAAGERPFVWSIEKIVERTLDVCARIALANRGAEALA